MTDQTYIIGTKGIDEEPTIETNEPVWVCNACGQRTCVEHGKKPTECTKVRNLPKPDWTEEPR